MVFSSLLFTFYFLPIVIVLYYLAKEKYRNWLLVLASLLFYAYGEPKYVLVMMGSILANYLFALAIDDKRERSPGKARLVLAFSVLANIGMLFVFKYLNFSITLFNRLFGKEIPQTSLSLPIGISFFTFQALSYCIDVYRGNVSAKRNIVHTALYVSFFPQLIAGPIVRYSSIEEQIASRRTGLDSYGKGIRRFFIGFSKKVIIANNLSVVSANVWGTDPSVTNPLMLWIGSVAFSLQIYYDFSGYSDMAIGLGRIFGFEFEENFNYPYISGSITEFWRRWHISLSSWFRDYVYIPLGGSRVGIVRHIFNLFIVWLLTGLWHGANVTFVLWGLFYFLFLVIEKWIIRPEKRNRIIRYGWQIITLILVNIAWVLFNSTDIDFALRFIKGMFGLYGTTIEYDPIVVRTLIEYGAYFAVGLIFATPLSQVIGKNIRRRPFAAAVSAVINPIVLSFLFLWSVSFLIMGYHNPFIYFNF